MNRPLTRVILRKDAYDMQWLKGRGLEIVSVLASDTKSVRPRSWAKLRDGLDRNVSMEEWIEGITDFTCVRCACPDGGVVYHQNVCHF